MWALEGMKGWRGKSSVKGNNVYCMAQSEECSFHKTSVLKPEAQGQLHIWDPCYAQDWSAFCLTMSGPDGIEGLARPAGLTGKCSRFRQKAKPGFARHFFPLRSELIRISKKFHQRVSDSVQLTHQKDAGETLSVCSEF